MCINWEKLGKKWGNIQRNRKSQKKHFASQLVAIKLAFSRRTLDKTTAFSFQVKIALKWSVFPISRSEAKKAIRLVCRVVPRVFIVMLYPRFWFASNLRRCKRGRKIQPKPCKIRILQTINNKNILCNNNTK